MVAHSDVRARRPIGEAGAHAAASPPKPEAERGFRPDVQGLRAIAVGLVVVYHLYPTKVPGGFVGVDVFFAISGFLITGHLLRTLERTGRVGFVEFYGRRARRLMPAAALVLAVTWIAAQHTLPGTRLPATAEQVRASALYFQNWVLAHDAVSYLTANDAPSPVQHFWSLSVEEQFYIVWPLLFLLAAGAALLATRRLRASGAGDDAVVARRATVVRGVLFTLGLVVVVASLAYSVHETRANPAAAYYITTTRMWELGLGGLLALLARRVARPLAKFGPLGWVGLAMVIASAFVISGSSPFPGSIALLPVGGAVLLIACGSAQARFGPARLTSVRPMVFLGDISYSIYLWHWPLIVLWKAHTGNGIGYLDGPAIALTSVMLAWLTKLLVEDRVRLAAFFARHKWRSLATVAAALVPVTLASFYGTTHVTPYHVALDAKHPGAAAIKALNASPTPTATTSASPLAAKTSAKRAARSPVPPASWEPPVEDAQFDLPAYSHGPGGCQTVQLASRLTECTYGDTVHPRLTVALVGDSVAGEWFAPLNAIAKAQHWKLVMDLHSLCPWTTTMTQKPSASGDYTACHTWGRNVLTDLLTKVKPDVVITSARPAIGIPGDPAPNPQSWTAIGDGMAAYWQQLIARGIPVVAIAESPEMGRDMPDCLSSPGGSVSSCSVARSQAIRPGRPLEVAAAKVGSGAHLIDMNSLICGPKTCSPVVGNIVVYRDKHHLTRTYTITLQPYLERKLLATHVFG